jgi:ribosome-binding factor A
MSKNSRRTHARRTPSVTSTLSPGDTQEEGAGHRQTRLEHILLDELQSLIRTEATDPSIEGVTVLAVNLSPDGGHARVAYAVAAPLHREQEIHRTSKAGLVRATGFLRARLAQQLDLKRLPKLTFTFVGVLQSQGGSDTSGGEPCPE